MKKSADLFELSQAYHLRAFASTNLHVWYLDHMASKPIPHTRRDTTDSWGKEHMIVHLAGEFRSQKDSVHYALYPNLINESANIIILQIDKMLRQIEDMDSATEIVFIMDNHATQKNAFVLGYLEWMAKTFRIPKTCLIFFKSILSL